MTCGWSTGQFYLDVEGRMTHVKTQRLRSSAYPLRSSALSLRARAGFFHLYRLCVRGNSADPATSVVHTGVVKTQAVQAWFERICTWTCSAYQQIFSPSLNSITPDTHHYANLTPVLMDNGVFPGQLIQLGQTFMGGISLTVWIRLPYDQDHSKIFSGG